MIPRLAALLLALALPAASAGAEGRFEVQKLGVDGDVLAVAPADLDGDGHKDLVASFKRGHPPDETRFLAVFWNQSGQFSPRPDVVLPVDEAVGAFNLADIDDQPGDELILIGRDGVSGISWQGRSPSAPSRLTSDATLFWAADRGALPRLRVVQDLSGPGSRELLVPTLGALLVYPRSQGRFGSPRRLSVDMKTDLGRADRHAHGPGLIPSLALSARFPAVQLADTDGDGRTDLVFTLEDRVAVFRQRGPLVFDAQPSFRRNFAIRTEEELKEAYSTASVVATDLDGDGVADLVLRKQVGHGITSGHTVTLLYLGRKGGTYEARPDQTIQNDGVASNELELADLTGDGHPDLILPSVTIGVWAIVRVLTTKTLKVAVRVHPFQSDRRFSTKPATERELRFKVSFAGDSSLPAFDIRGDYNGDRRADLVFGMSDDKLSVFPGLDGPDLVAREPIEEITVDSRGELQPVELDGKGKDDMVMFYPATAGHRSELVVIGNRGPW